VRRIEEKIVSLDEARKRIAGWHGEGVRIVLATGMFDPLEAADARDLAAVHPSGSRLVVGVASDRAISMRLGPGRPIVPFEDRCRVVAALATVDLVVEGVDEDADEDVHTRLGLTSPDTVVEIARTPDLVARIRTRLAPGRK
jgi:D-beta-D-heptose 7-phosphate kinase/D-beta-D-heptose 1-phosphate adenosyltransferase